MSERYDLCVIGAGSAGFAAAEAARALGKRTLLVSGPGDLGGTCILRGCMPAKALLSSTERLGEIETAGALGVQAGNAHVDLPALIARKRELVDYFAEDRAEELESFPLARGCARFIARDAIVVEDRRIEAERFVIATGSTIAPPPIQGLAECGYFTSDGALEITRAPRTLAIVGAGPVGCEFAQYFARLGTRVTLFQREPDILRNEDADLARVVAVALRADGIDLRTDTEIRRCTKDGGECALVASTGGRTFETRVEQIMLASERIPQVANLALDVAGVATRNGAVAVDRFLRTTNDAIFAAGDVIGRRNLVHVAVYGGNLAASNAFAGEPAGADFDRYEAHAVYTQPQIGVAGLTELLCRARGLAVRVRTHSFRDIGKALVSDSAEGFVKMIVGPDDRIVGVAIVGDGAIDLIGEAIALIDAGRTTRQVAEMPHLHPTMGEIYARVAEGFATPQTSCAS
jgi:pyruvate/2-oxoglutarate dehydrogenase complex dihydrolipoamide dehydrogenase (E3) component